MEGIEDQADVVLDHRVGDGHDHAHGMHASKEFGGQAFPEAVITGIGDYIWNFAPHPDAGGKYGSLLLFCLLLVLEVIGSVVKPFSLSIRLFANMLAGHLVPAALIGLIPFGVGASIAVIGGISLPVVLGFAPHCPAPAWICLLRFCRHTFLCFL